MKKIGLSDSLLQKGCKTVVGWNGPISMAKTDETIYQLIKELGDNESWKDPIIDLNDQFSDNEIMLVTRGLD